MSFMMGTSLEQSNANPTFSCRTALCYVTGCLLRVPKYRPSRLCFDVHVLLLQTCLLILTLVFYNHSS